MVCYVMLRTVLVSKISNLGDTRERGKEKRGIVSHVLLVVSRWFGRKRSIEMMHNVP